MTIACRKLKVKVNAIMYAQHQHDLLRRPDGRNSMLLLSHNQLRASAARRAARRDQGQKQRRSSARVGVVIR